MGRTIEDIIGTESDPAVVRRQSLFNMRQYAIQQGWKIAEKYTMTSVTQAEYVNSISNMAHALTDKITEDLVNALAILDVPLSDMKCKGTCVEAKPS